MNDIGLLRCTELTKTDFHNDNQTDNFNLNINMFQIETHGWLVGWLGFNGTFNTG